jgi:hypothetical protein
MHAKGPVRRKLPKSAASGDIFLLLEEQKALAKELMLLVRELFCYASEMQETVLSAQSLGDIRSLPNGITRDLKAFRHRRSCPPT